MVSAPTDRSLRAPGTPAGPVGVLDRRHRRLTVGIVATVLLIAFEAMSVGTVMPVAVRELEGMASYAWGFSAFLITSLLGMVIAGDACDTRGPRRPFLVAGAAFLLGLLLAGTATSMPAFVLGRAVQGLGGGMAIVALYVVVARAYPDAMHPRVFSVISSAWVLPSILGPALSGWLADTVTWRLVFLGVPPLALPALLLILPALRTMDGAAPDASDRSRARSRLRLAGATALGVALLQYAGQRAGWAALPLAAVGITLLVPSLPRLLPAGTLRAARGLPTAVLMRGVLAGAFFGAEAFLPLMLIDVRGLSTALAGLSLTGAALGWAAGSWYQGRPRLRTPRHRLVQAGAVLVALAVAGALLTLWPVLPAWTAALAWAVGGVGMGLGMSSFSVIVLELSAPQDTGANSAALQMSDAVASIVVLGAAGVVYAALRENGALPFAAIFAVMLALAGLGAVLAPRVRPAGLPG